MNDTDRDTFADALNELHAFYEAHAVSRDVWWRVLSKYPYTQVQAAFDAHVTDPEQGIYPPKPAHIVGHIERLYPKRSGCYAAYKPSTAPPRDHIPWTLSSWLQAHADDPLVERAWLLAEGKGTDQDKHEHLQDLMRLAQGIATPPPYDPRRRHLPTTSVDNSPVRRSEACDRAAPVEEVTM